MPPDTAESRHANRRFALLLVVRVIGVLALIPAARAAAPPVPPGIPTSPGIPADVRAVVDTFCLKCHGPKKQGGGVDFSLLTDERSVLRARKVWRKAVAQVGSEEMPPAGAKQPTRDQREKLLDWMRQTMTRVDAGDPAHRDPGPPIIRRLSLSEYTNSVRELLGVEFNAADAVGLPDESGEGNVFGNTAAALDVPPVLLDKYFAAADRIVDRLFGTEPSSNVDGRVQERARHSREALFGLKPDSWREPRKQVITPPDGVSPREAARKLIGPVLRAAYRRPVRPDETEQMLRLYDRVATRPEKHVDGVRLMLTAVLVSPNFLFRVETDRPGARADAPYPIDDHDLAARLSFFLWSSLPDDVLRDLADRGRLSAPGESGEPTKLSGLIIGSPANPRNREASQDNAFDGTRVTYFEGEKPDGTWIGLDLRAARKLTAIRFAAPDWQGHRMTGGKFQAAPVADFSSGVTDLYTVPKDLRHGVTAVPLTLATPYRYVRYLGPPGSHGLIAEFEMWGVAGGTVLDQQIRRMLDDPRARALTDDFASRWLQTNKLSAARPSTEFFPEFQPDVRKAMYDETAAFFDGLRLEDRPLTDLLDADYTYVNEKLAAYYKIPGVTGERLRRVVLKPEYHRGGLLGMGSILALTSHTSRTSPTLRGKWVLEVLFGTPPPPPPANAGMLKDESQPGKEPTSFREKLALHARDVGCASCHKRMDPLGFALDNFDAAGAWRETDKGKPLDTTGVMPDGAKFNGAAELKRLVVRRRGEFFRNLSEQMLTYALGRELDYFDDPAVAELQRSLNRGEFRFSALIRGVVTSYPFRHRRNAAERDPPAKP